MVFANLIPSDVIKSIHSYGIAEDGQTLIVMLDTVDGATLMIQANAWPTAQRGDGLAFRRSHRSRTCCPAGDPGFAAPAVPQVTAPAP